MFVHRQQNGQRNKERSGGGGGGVWLAGWVSGVSEVEEDDPGVWREEEPRGARNHEGSRPLSLKAVDLFSASRCATIERDWQRNRLSRLRTVEVFGKKKFWLANNNNNNNDNKWLGSTSNMPTGKRRRKKMRNWKSEKELESENWSQFWFFPINHHSLDVKTRHLSLRGFSEKLLTTSTYFPGDVVYEEHQYFRKLHCHEQHMKSHPNHSKSAHYGLSCIGPWLVLWMNIKHNLVFRCEMFP